MKQTILKRHNNYILRIRKIYNNSIVYNWYFSKELSNILKIYGKIEQWQFDNIENTVIRYVYSYQIINFKRLTFNFKYILKDAQNNIIFELLQFYNKTGKYS